MLRPGSFALLKSAERRKSWHMTPAQEQAVAVLAILVVCAMGVYRLVLWIMEAPLTPDPWDKEVEDALNNDDAVAICHHCLTPQKHSGWFCPECGATVGPYCNYMPYLYVFAQGEVLRAGVTERIRRNPLVTAGFVLFSLSMSVILAPIYWFFLFKNLRRGRQGVAESAAGV